MNQDIRKAVITGMGAICALGNFRVEILQNVKNATSKIRPIKTYNIEKLSTKVGGEVGTLDHQFPDEIQDKSSQLAYIAMTEAVQESGLDFANENP